MNMIRKAIIPCGGLGTRFLPVTKSVPKEILPIIDTPVLAHIVEELTISGIEQIYIILGHGKEAIKEYFAPNPSLEARLKNKPALLETLRNISKTAEIRFGMQQSPRGSGDAVMCARSFTGDEPFLMSNGDDLIVAETPASKQLMDAYDRLPGVIVGVQKVDPKETYKYGIMDATKIDGRTVFCKGIVEKPKDNPPSLYAAFGRYVMTPDIYEYIEKVPEVNGEVSLTDALCAKMRENKGYAYDFEGRRYDMGDKFGAVTATVDFALKRADMKDKLKKYLLELLNDEN